MNRDRLLLIGGLALVVVGLIGGSITEPGSVAGGWGPRGGMPMMGWLGEATPPVYPGAEEMVVGADEFSFSPDEVIVDPGSGFNLTVVNEGALVHDLTIPSLGVSIAVAPGERSSAGLRNLAAGSYPFLCTVPGHSEAGMTGTLFVEETTDGG